MVDSYVLLLPLHGSEGAHGHPPHRIAGHQLLQNLSLVPIQGQADVLKGPFLGPQRGNLEAMI